MRLALLGTGLAGPVLERLIDERRVKDVVCLDRCPLPVKSRKIRFVGPEDPGGRALWQDRDALIVLPRGGASGLGSDPRIGAALAGGVRAIVDASWLVPAGVLGARRVRDRETASLLRSVRSSVVRSHVDFELESIELESLALDHAEVALARFLPAAVVGRRTDRAAVARLSRREGGEDPLALEDDAAEAIVRAAVVGARGLFAVGASLGEPASFERNRAGSELRMSPRCATRADVLERFSDLAPERLDRRISCFLRLCAFETWRHPRENELGGLDGVVVHLGLSGRAGGDLALAIRGGRIRVGAGVPEAPDGTVSLEARLFLDLLAGRADLSTAFLTGAIVQRGESQAGAVFGGLISAFHAAARSRSLRGLIARGVVRWLAKGGAS